MVSEVSAQRSTVPSVPRFRCRTQLLAIIYEKHASPFAKTRAKRLTASPRARPATTLTDPRTFTGHWNYTHTIRRPRVRGQIIEVKTQLSHRDYMNMLSQKDETHHPIYKKRRCFIHYNQYFQLDIYCKPCHPRYVCV